LIVTSLVQAEKHKNFDGSVANGYINAEILMSIIDVNSGLVVDKISLLADQGLMSFSGRGMDNLVYEPMLAVARELAGGN